MKSLEFENFAYTYNFFTSVYDLVNFSAFQVKSSFKDNFSI